MIVNHEHRFAFVHIPKCAGTSVRTSLQVFDSLKGQFTDRVSRHPVLGELDCVHIPLFILRDYFEAEFEAIRDYWSFAVIRDPFSRFASSISQRLRMYSALPIQKRSLREIETYIDESICYLSQRDAGAQLLPPEYIHFQRQTDYVQLEGEQVVDALYTVDNIGSLLNEVSQRVGRSVTSAKEPVAARANRTVVFRNDLLRHIFVNARPLTNQIGKALPEGTKQLIRDRVYVPRDQRLKKLFATDRVLEFINEYYERDIALYQKISERERTESL